MIDLTFEPPTEPGSARFAPAFAGLARAVSPGDVLRERYVLQARLGAGSSGSVFKALDRLRSTLPDAHRYVALKVLNAGARSLEHTVEELRLQFHCAQLLSHRNIVKVYELDRDGDLLFFTMEALEGETLSQVIKRLRPGAIGRSQAWQLIRQLGAALAHAHERGVLHGNLNPENIFIPRDGVLRILNFGVSGRLPAKSPPDPADATPACDNPRSDKKRVYASCEQLEGKRPDPRDDLYSLACISYELLAGTHPFGSRPATLARDYRVSLTRPDHLSGRQWRALQQGLAWHRGGRSSSVRAWMQRVMPGRNREHSVTPLQDLAAPQRVHSRTPWGAAALVVVLSLAAALVVARLRSSATFNPSDAPSAAPSRVVAATPAPDDVSASQGGPVSVDPAPPPAVVSAGKAGVSSGSQARPASKAKPMAISVEPSQVTAEDHFAEIRLHRDVLQKNGSFTWWTEPATAKPGVDYTPEAVAIQTFPQGYRSTRLYVRLLPQALRSQRSYFYIAIAQPGPHQAAASVIRRQVWLPPSTTLQARR